jgi:hypothetical protein
VPGLLAAERPDEPVQHAHRIARMPQLIMHPAPGAAGNSASDRPSGLRHG